MRVAVVGGGWAGLSAAIAATQAGHTVHLFEAARSLGGRARALACEMPDGSPVTLDNGQHILIGAYRHTLDLLRLLGVDEHEVLLRIPLALVFPDGQGLYLPRWPAGLDALGGILGAPGWSLADKCSLLRQAMAWRSSGFRCAANLSVADICTRCSPRVVAELVEPLCVSALNVPTRRASAQVFLRVLQDALFGASGGSNLLLPRVDLSRVFPDAAARWLAQHGAEVRLGARARSLQADGASWQLDGVRFDQVLIATTAPEATRIVASSIATAPSACAGAISEWCAIADTLQHTAITTVYAWAGNARLARPMLALRDSATPSQPAPAQFVFDRGQLGGPKGLLAFVVSASEGDRDTLQAHVLAQAKAQLGYALQPVQTVVEKRAAFACTPGLRRPPRQIAPGLLACADYVDGPYPSTLEGAVRSGAAIPRS